MLVVRDLRFSYGDRQALKGISLELKESEVLCLTGPNGSGKSTLLKCINRVLNPNRGEILFRGKDLGSMRRNEIAKIFSYVPQETSTSFNSVRVIEVVLMGRKPHVTWYPSRRDLEVAWKSLRIIGLEHLAMRRFSELSGGEKQRVLLARALAQEASVLLLDEPTANLDLKHQVRVMSLLRDLTRSRGISALIAIHDLNLASMYCDRMILLKDGSQFASGHPESVLTSENIREVYGVDVIVSRDLGRPYVILMGNGSAAAPRVSSSVSERSLAL
ncbi:MAG: ABC transporter ATP-binding protein [Candidatus Korarchaeum sp.]|nr:ABC transporter ATP-binding protein [Candidatus Korarchaeum sp.]MDW8035640.1 ABC transporter ATP-binding protein [Candidatus Korarchaeum sp.]